MQAETRVSREIVAGRPLHAFRVRARRGSGQRPRAGRGGAGRHHPGARRRDRERRQPALAGGGGVDGAIHRAAGARAARGVRRARRLPDRRRQGDARLRAAGPLGHPHRRARSGAAAATASPSCWRRATGAASRWPTSSGPRSVAFPAISTGVYGYPPDAAATHRGRRPSARRRPPVELVRLVAFDERDAAPLRGTLWRVELRLSGGRAAAWRAAAR